MLTLTLFAMMSVCLAQGIGGGGGGGRTSKVLETLISKFDPSNTTIAQDYANNQKWVAYVDAKIVQSGFASGGVQFLVDLADYSGVTAEGRDGWITVWIDVVASTDVEGPPIGFGLEKRAVDPNAPDMPTSLFSASLNQSFLYLPVLSLDVNSSGDHPSADLSLGTGSLWSEPSIDFTVHGLSFEIRREVLDQLIANPLQPGMSINDFCTGALNSVVGISTTQLVANLFYGFRLATPQDDPNLLLMPDICANQLVIGDTGTVSVNVRISSSGNYHVRVWDQSGLFSPPWTWQAVTSPSAYLTAGQLSTIILKVAPNTANENFAFFLYEEDGITSRTIEKDVCTLYAAPAGTDVYPPTVSIIAPANNSLVNGSTTLQVTAADQGSGLDHVDLYLDANLIGSTSLSSYSQQVDLSSLGIGEHFLSAIAVDKSGLRSQDRVKVIKNPLQIISSIFDKQSYDAGAMVNLSIQLDNSTAGATVTASIQGSAHQCSDLGAGRYSISFTAPSANGVYPVLISASKPGYSDFHSAIPLVVASSSISLTANPSVINYDGRSSSTIIATVLDGLGNPEAGVQVVFTPPLTLPYGSCNPGSVSTNASGKAQTTYSPDGTGDATISVSAASGMQGSIVVHVNTAGQSTYHIQMTERELPPTSTTQTTYVLDPYVTYSSNSQCVDAQSITLRSSKGTFDKTGTPQYSEILGANNSCGLTSYPRLTTQVGGLDTVWATVGPTTQFFVFNMAVGPLPSYSPFAVLSNGQNLANPYVDRNVSISPSGNLIVTPRGIIYHLPSLTSIYSTSSPTGTFSFSASGSKLILGGEGSNPSWCIYDSATNNSSCVQVTNMAPASVAWSNLTDDPVYAVANFYSGHRTEINVYYHGYESKISVSNINNNEQINAIDWKGNHLAVVTKNGAIYVYDMSNIITSTQSNEVMPLLWGSTVGNVNKYSVAISADGRKLAACGQLQTGGNCLYIFNDILSSTPTYSVGLSGGLMRYYSVDWSPDGTRLVCGGENSYLKILDSTGTELSTLTTNGEIESVKWGASDVIAAVVQSNTNLYAPFDVTGPTISVHSPIVGFATMEDTMTVSAIVQDPIGVDSAWLSLDGINFTSLPILSDSLILSTVVLNSGRNDVQILARDRNGNLSQMTTTVFSVSAPTVTTLITPADLVTGSSLRMKFVWNEQIAGTNYWFQLSQDSLFFNDIVNDSLVADTTYNYSNLKGGTTYYWRVKTKNLVGWGDFSRTFRFSTLGPPGSVTTLYPFGGSTEIPTNLQFVWLKPQFTSGSTFYFSVTQDTNWIQPVLADSTIVDTSHYVDSLNYSTWYFWRVASMNEAGRGQFSGWKSFQTIQAPPNPVSITSKDSSNQLILRWTDANVGGSVYVVFWWDDSTVSNPFCARTTSNSYEVSTFADKHQYWWKVRVENIGGISAFSSVHGLYIDTTLTGVRKGPSLPKVYSLAQNYPNPFNPTTSIRFALPKSSYVTLKVFNLLGQEVTALVNQELQAGYHDATWDASKMPSGMYFYRIQAAGFVETKKLLLMK